MITKRLVPMRGLNNVFLSTLQVRFPTFTVLLLFLTNFFIVLSAVLQDFCSVTGKTTALAGRSWFRNTLDGSPVGSQGECTEDSRANSILACDQDPACDTLGGRSSPCRLNLCSDRIPLLPALRLPVLQRMHRRALRQ